MKKLRKRHSGEGYIDVCVLVVCAMLVLLMTPGLAFFYGGLSRRKNVVNTMVMVFGVLGIVVNRFNVCLVAFNWQLDSADRYFPSISEVFLSIFIVTLIVTAYRFVCSKMPVLYEHPDFKDAH